MGPYFLITNTYTVEDRPHIGYGIGCRADNSAFEDMSTDPFVIDSLISLCNKAKLSPLHLKDVVEDFLADTR